MKYLMIVALFFGVSSNVVAQAVNIVSNEQTDWQKITLTTVNFEQSMKEMLVAGNQRFRSMYFRVAAGQVDIKSLQVFFENGAMQDIAVNEIVKVNANSRVLDLTGDERIVKKIVMKYKAVPNTDDKEARLELWGSQIKNIR